MTNKLIITPKTKVAELLDAFPHLEDVLIELAPQFKKLQNPVLRKTIARVTTLQQAAIVGKIPVDKLVNELRRHAGQEPALENSDENKYLGLEKPGWFSGQKVSKRLDARPLLEEGKNPLALVLKEVQELGEGDIYELTTAFLPAPLIDQVKAKGFSFWANKETEDVIKTYFISKRTG